MEMKRNLIFNQEGSSSKEDRYIIKGSTTNILELNNIKYQWAYDMYKLMGFTNFWIPEEISLNDDRKQYETSLSEYEKRAYEMVLSFLIVLDSYQVNMLKEFSRYITSPELILCLTAQEFQEGLHSYSYQYILESVVDKDVADKVYNYWKEDKVLNERIKVIASLYNNFVENPTEENFIKAVFGNYILEGLYFYSGFAMFYTLARQGKMINTSQEIKYINRDELTHISLFKNIILTLKQENPELFTDELNKWVYEIFKYAIDAEIKWGQHTTNNQILGLNNQLIESYVKYLGNQRLLLIGYEPIYKNNTENPLKWIDTFRTINDTKTDFFEKKVLGYSKRNELKW